MTAPAARRRPPGRYDAPSRVGGRITAVVLGVLFVGLLLAIAAALYQRIAAVDVRARVIDFQVRSDTTVRIDVEVLKPRGERAYCVLRARGPSGAEVGREVVAIDPVGTDERVVRVEHDLATTSRATTGEAGRCAAQPPRTSPPAP